MPEIQNIFIKSKMNQDIDDRLVPRGEYRKALNIAISRSEGSDVGTVQNALGNSLIAITEISGIKNLDVIGYYIDQSQDDIYVFLTDYVDSSSSGIANFAPSTANCFIYRYNAVSNLYTRLVEGYYLNFSKNSPVLGVNILEGLLFFTDNRNQPRKINVSTAATDISYYNSEDKISVAKYYPYTPINLVNLAGDSLGESTMTNPAQQFLDIEKGGEVYDNPDYDEDWAGDQELLSDKFVRFSYRFKFDDGEYSLQAPWTQVCFIPKQQGYFNTEDASAAYRSTVVSFMENNVTQMLLNIYFPTANPISDFNISSVDILYKESDALAIKVIETIPAETVYTQMQANTNNLVYSYKYISTKPYKTLPSDESTRVYDVVPVKALAQEIISNRVIYGNFFDKHTPPNFLNYGVGFGLKDPVVTPVEKIYSQIEYPSSSLKQNRNYQVGFVLADRFGRQSSVILSAKDSGTTSEDLLFGGSTIYVPYANAGVNALNFPGYELKVLVNTIEGGSAAIPVSPNLSTGYPGVYKDNLKGVDAIIINQAGTGYSSGTDISTTGGAGTGCTVDVVTNVSGEITSVTINKQGTGYRDGDLLTPSGAGSNGLLTATVYDPNPLGWYSYKIVVKQTEQEYYNVYLPGILNGYPFGSALNGDPINAQPELNQTANIVLFSDNINKVPKDLSEVGPDQRQYRSSVNLFGRVTPYPDVRASNYSTQYYPIALPDSIPNIATLRDTNYIATLNIPGQGLDLSYNEFYQSDTNPSIARVSTNNGIGKVSTNAEDTYGDALGIYETGPVTSLLDIYWETSTVGLISELNKIVQVDFEGPASLELDNPYVHSESDPPGYQITAGKAVDGDGGVFADNQITYSLVSVLDDNGYNVSQFSNTNQARSGVNCYELVSRQSDFTLSISNDTYFYYESVDAQNNFTFTVSCYDNQAGTDTFLEFTGSLSNTPPAITFPAAPGVVVSYTIGTLEGTVIDMSGNNGVNSGAFSSTKVRELVWSMGNAFNTIRPNDPPNPNNFGFTIDSTTGLVEVDDLFITSGTVYEMPITLTDSGGAADAVTYDLQVSVSSTQTITFKSYNKNSSTAIGALPVLRKISYQWEDEFVEQEILFPASGTTLTSFEQNSSTASVSPYTNSTLQAKISFDNTNTNNTFAKWYIYKGDPGQSFDPVNGILPPGVTLLHANPNVPPTTTGVPYNATYTIQTSDQVGSPYLFTTFLLIDDIAG